MTDAELDLARRLAAHPRWKWMDGILSRHGCRVVGVVRDQVVTDSVDGGGRLQRVPLAEMAPPDLDDPATQGCLWAMLDEALVFPSVFIDDCPAKWIVEVYPGGDRERFAADRKGEALARALLAAWGEP